MMKFAVVLVFFSLSFTAFAQQDNLPDKLDEYFTTLAGIRNFNGNVIISKDGKKLLDKTYLIPGETDRLKVTRDSRFIVASVSKVFIKFALLKLAEQNKLRLSDKLSKFIPDFPSGERITVEQLMHHQSGLPREIQDFEKYDSVSLEKAVELAKREKLLFEPGTQTFYSNVGYFLLHYIIDKTSPHGYLDFLQKEIFNKMKLKATAEFNSAASIPNFAYGYDNEDGKIVPTALKNINRFETGNYVTTIGALYSFSRQMDDGKSLKKSFANELFNKDGVIAQAGGRPGYRAYFYKNLKTGITFLFTSNYTDIPVQEAIADVINILSGKPYEVPKKVNRIEIEVPVELLRKYTGKFSMELDPSQVFSIELVGNKLIFKDKDDEATDLHPDSETTFFEKADSKDSYIFSLNSATGKYDLTIISTGIRLKMKRIE